MSEEKAVYYADVRPLEAEKVVDKAGLYAKMSLVMGKMERLPKRGHNAYFNYDFVTDADVLDAVRSAMAEAGLALFTTLVDVQQSDTKTVAKFDFTFVDGTSGQCQTVQWVGEALDKQDKGVTKAATAALKSLLLKTFLISTGDEVELDAELLQEAKPVLEEGKSKHWIANEGVRARFWVWTGDELGLSEGEVHTALGVKSVYEFTGSMKEAKAKIEAWVAEQSKAKPTAADCTECGGRGWVLTEETPGRSSLVPCPLCVDAGRAIPPKPDWPPRSARGDIKDLYGSQAD